LNICMVTPHLPPDQAANALLPQLLGEGLRDRGHEVTFVAFEPRHGGRPTEPSLSTIRRPANGWARKVRLSQLSTLIEVFKKAGPFLRDADVVHVHSNTFMNQVSAFLAYRRGRPFILTHYGTEIWHYRRRKPIDPFLWMNRKAAHVTYYSRLLLERSLELGVDPPERSVIYPPADKRFRTFTLEEREEARRSLGIGPEPLLINVKRLHPLAGQRYLVEAMPAVLNRFPDAKAWIAGEGESRVELEALIAEKSLGSAVRLLGLVDNRELPRYYAAADVFVLPSLLEAFPTVAAEALACGTPVVTADHPGGKEIRDLFPTDVRVVPKRNAGELAQELLDVLYSPRRCSSDTLSRIESEFRPEATVEAYLKLYRKADSEQRLA
jgi:glycosyltransferase involved in cell wall biosynthesis